MALELLPGSRACYLCGLENQKGWAIRYHVDTDTGEVSGQVRPDEHFCGFPGIFHGGLQGALMDDVMWWAASWRTRTSAVTARMSTSFKATAHLGGTFTLRAGVERVERRKVWARGAMEDAAGKLLCEAEGLFITSGRDEFVSEVLPMFDFTGCSAMIERHYKGNDR